MKFIILLAFVALCYSYPYGTGVAKNINISEDGTIVITGSHGKKVTITKGTGPTGQKNIEIEITAPNVPMKKIQINEQNSVKVVNEEKGEFSDQFYGSDEYQRDKRSSKNSRRRGSQGDILTEILKQYQGAVDEQAYEKLLKHINDAVQSGDLNPSIYEVLKSLSQNVVARALWSQQQGFQGQQDTEDVLQDLLQRQAIQQQLQDIQQQQFGQRGTYGVQPQIFSQQGQETPYLTGRRITGGTMQGLVFEVPTTGSLGQSNTGVLIGEQQEGFGSGRTFQTDVGKSIANLIVPGRQRSVVGELAEIAQEERQISNQQQQLQQQQMQQLWQQQQLQQQLQQQQQAQQLMQQQLQRQQQQQSVQQQLQRDQQQQQQQLQLQQHQLQRQQQQLQQEQQDQQMRQQQLQQQQQQQQQKQRLQQQQGFSTLEDMLGGKWRSQDESQLTGVGYGRQTSPFGQRFSSVGIY